MLFAGGSVHCLMDVKYFQSVSNQYQAKDIKEKQVIIAHYLGDVGGARKLTGKGGRGTA